MKATKKVAEKSTNKKIAAVQARRATTAKKAGIKPPTAAELKAIETAELKPVAGSIRKQLVAGGILTIKGAKRRVERVSHDGDLIDVFFPGGDSVTFQDPGPSVGEPVLMTTPRNAIQDLPAEENVEVPETQPKEEPPVQAPPVTPLTKLLLNAGFTFVKSNAIDEQNTAHGYQHEDGSAALVSHANTSPNVGTRWVVKRMNADAIEGKTAKELAVALIKPKPLPANVITALDMLRKATKCSYRLSTLAGDDNYKLRVQLLKKLRNTDKVLAKDSGVNRVVEEFYTALSIPGPSIAKTGSAAARATAFETKCAELYKVDQKAARAVVRVEKAEVKVVLQNGGRSNEVHDGKPVLPLVKKVGVKRQRELDEQAKTDLAGQIARKRREEEYTPLAVPRPEASIAVNLDDVCLLEDPDNGIVLICLEKPNSQGAICVYNNGSRVAAGVLPTEELIRMRSFPSEDLVRDINHFLHPLTSGVSVTPVAEGHLTAVLMHCKEKIIMANETAVKTKKFAAPKNATAAKPNGKTEKAAKAAKPAKAVKVSTRVKFADELKIKVMAVALKAEGGNPYREGTKARNSFELIKKSANFGELAKLTEKAQTAGKVEVYDAAYILKWASQPHGNAPAYVSIG